MRNGYIFIDKLEEKRIYLFLRVEDNIKIDAKDKW
jgi:hypothetical protein